MKKLLSKVFVSLLVVSMCIIALPTMSYAAEKQPVLHFEFEDNVNDSSGNNYHGTKMGVIDYDTGVKGKCAYFNGKGCIKLESCEGLHFTDELTMSVWVRVEGYDHERCDWPILYREFNEYSYAVQQMCLGYGGTDFCSTLHYGDADNYWEYFFNGPRFEQTQLGEKWAHLVFVVKGEEVMLYLDGEMADYQVIESDVFEYGRNLITSAKPYMIGKNNKEFFYGYMDELKLYDCALTEQEVAAIYEENLQKTTGEIKLVIDEFPITINGVISQMDTVPTILNGRTVLPIRPIVDAIGGKIGYDSTERRVDITHGETVIKLWLDKYNAEVNGKSEQLDVAPLVMNGRTMLPLRYVAEKLGMVVSYEKATQTITLKY